MEIKLTKEKLRDSGKEIKLKQAERETANAVLTEDNRKADRAIQLQSDEKRQKRIAVLRCGTVRLRNFTEDLSEPGRLLRLIREPENPYDRWATKVCTLDGGILGYLPSRKNQSVARLMDAGKNITVFVDETLGTPVQMSGVEDPRLPLILYMDIHIPEEKELCEQV